jgi:protein SCO1
VTALVAGCGAPGGAGVGGTMDADDASAVAGVTNDHEHHVHATAPEPAEPSGHSLFHLGSEWWDQHGETRRLESLGGRVQVVSMVYTNCSYACPRIIADMKRLSSLLGPEYGDRVGFVLVSVDPERDTPGRLARFASDVGLEPERWTLLASDEMSTLELATVLGVRYRRESETDFSHTNMLAVLAPTGELVHRQLALGDDLEEVVRAIRALSS